MALAGQTGRKPVVETIRQLLAVDCPNTTYDKPQTYLSLRSFLFNNLITLKLMYEIQNPKTSTSPPSFFFLNSQNSGHLSHQCCSYLSKLIYILGPRTHHAGKSTVNETITQDCHEHQLFSSLAIKFDTFPSERKFFPLSFLDYAKYLQAWQGSQGD